MVSWCCNSIVSGGSGYKTGDVLGASLGETGRNIRFTVGAVSNVNSVILNRVQGEFNTSDSLKFMNNTGISTNLNNGVPELQLQILDWIKMDYIFM